MRTSCLQLVFFNIWYRGPDYRPDGLFIAMLGKVMQA